MASEIYRANLRGEIDGILQRARTGAAVDHKGLAGRFREHMFDKLLALVLPSTAAIGKGKIVDSFGNESGDADLIVYSPNLLAPVFYQKPDGCFPIEACLYHIEVKTKLTASELGDSIAKVERLRQLKMLRFEGDPPPYPLFSSLFAFDTDLQPTGKGELERYLGMEGDIAFTNPAFCSICVAGRSLLLVRPNETGLELNQRVYWQESPASDDHDEVIDYLGTIANGINDAIESRRFPRLGPYVIHPRPFHARFPNGARHFLSSDGQVLKESGRP